MWCHPAMVYEQNVNMFVCSLSFLVYPLYTEEMFLQSDVHQVFSTCNAFMAIKYDGSIVAWGGRRSGGDASMVSRQLQVAGDKQPAPRTEESEWAKTSGLRGVRFGSKFTRMFTTDPLRHGRPWPCLKWMEYIESYRGISTFIIYLKFPLYVTILTFFSDFGWDVLVVFRPWHIRGSSHRVPVLRSKPLPRMALAIHEPTGFSKSNLYDGLRLDPQRLRCIRC